MNLTVETKKVSSDDFEQIYPLFLEFKNPEISKKLWQNLFVDFWDFQKDFFGYKLVAGDQVVGFIAYILSKKKLGNRWEDFCYLSSWIVKKEFRKYKMDLLSPILDLDEHTFFSFSPSPSVFKIFTEHLEFQTLDTHEVIIPRVITLPAVFNRRPKIIREPSQINQHLTEEEKIIFKHHSSFKCQHLLIRWKHEHLYLITKKKLKKRLPFHKIYYLNSTDIFLNHLPFLRFHLPRAMKSFGLIIDSRFLKKKTIPLSLRKEFSVPMIFRSKRVLPDRIDYLYSEDFLLEE